MLWANLHLLFWLSLVPFVTAWMGENQEAAVPCAAYGVVLLMCGVAYTILLRTLLAAPGGNPRLAAAVGSDVKGRLSLLLYVAAIGLAFVNQCDRRRDLRGGGADVAGARSADRERTTQIGVRQPAWRRTCRLSALRVR